MRDARNVVRPLIAIAKSATDEDLREIAEAETYEAPVEETLAALRVVIFEQNCRIELAQGLVPSEALEFKAREGVGATLLRAWPVTISVLLVNAIRWGHCHETNGLVCAWQHHADEIERLPNDLKLPLLAGYRWAADYWNVSLSVPTWAEIEALGQPS